MGIDYDAEQMSWENADKKKLGCHDLHEFADLLDGMLSKGHVVLRASYTESAVTEGPRVLGRSNDDGEYNRCKILASNQHQIYPFDDNPDDWEVWVKGKRRVQPCTQVMTLSMYKSLGGWFYGACRAFMSDARTHIEQQATANGKRHDESMDTYLDNFFRKMIRLVVFSNRNLPRAFSASRVGKPNSNPAHRLSFGSQSDMSLSG